MLEDLKIRTIGGAARRRGRGPALGAIAIALFIAAPVLALLPAATADSQGLWRHLASTVLSDYIANTLLLGIGVLAVAGTIGTLSGWLLAIYRFPGHRLFEWALILPLAFPAYILAFLYTDLLQYAGPVQTALRDFFGWRHGDYWFPDIRSLGGAALVLGLTLYPYVFALARTAFVTQSAAAIEAARVLGRPPGSVFLRVALPMARPAIAAGCALCLMEAFADFGAVMYFGVDTFTVGVYRAWYAFDSKAVAAQLALALLAFVLIVVVLERTSRGAGQNAAAMRHQRHLTPIRLKGWHAAAATLFCAIPLLLGFVFPAFWLLHLSFGQPPELGWPRIFVLMGNSAILAVLAGATTIVLAVLAAWIVRQSGSKVAVLATRAAMLGYATPGAVIAVGLLIAIGAFDHLVDRSVFALTGHGTGLVLGGTLVAVLYGLTARFYAVGFGAVDAGFNRIGTQLDAAARTLGETPAGVLRRIYLPLLRPHMAVALVLVAADVLKELPATMILRPFNFDTLAVEVFRQATTEQLDGAAIPALMIVAVGLVPAIILARQIKNPGR